MEVVIPIPLYGVEAHGGRIVSLDDEATYKDLTNSAGAGGDPYSAFVVSSPFDQGAGGWSTLRRAVQHVHHDSGCIVTVTAIRDGQDTGQAISRSLAIGASYVVDAPLRVGGTTFGVKVFVQGLVAGGLAGPVDLGKAEQWVVPRRRAR